MMEKNNSDKFNDSGCVDLTAYEAIKNIENEEIRFKKLLHYYKVYL